MPWNACFQKEVFLIPGGWGSWAALSGLVNLGRRERGAGLPSLNTPHARGRVDYMGSLLESSQKSLEGGTINISTL